MGEAKLATYFVKNATKMVSDTLIVHYDQHLNKEVETNNWLPAGDITVGITAGGSRPNKFIRGTVRRPFQLRGNSVEELPAGCLPRGLPTTCPSLETPA